MYCHQCGKEINDEVKFCPYCGAPIDLDICIRDRR